jgi:hypothetical protein
MDQQYGLISLDGLPIVVSYFAKPNCGGPSLKRNDFFGLGCRSIDGPRASISLRLLSKGRKTNEPLSSWFLITLARAAPQTSFAKFALRRDREWRSKTPATLISTGECPFQNNRADKPRSSRLMVPLLSVIDRQEDCSSRVEPKTEHHRRERIGVRSFGFETETKFTASLSFMI